MKLTGELTEVAMAATLNRLDGAPSAGPPAAAVEGRWPVARG
jgi:hypothetical protein